MNGKLGIHSLMFGDDWSERAATEACAIAADIGYDLIEALIFDPASLDIPMTTRVVKAAGLELRLGMALGPDTDISSSEPEVAAAGEATVARCLEIAAETGAPAVSGITYAAFNSYDAPPTEAQRDQVSAALSRLGRRAAALGVRLGLEPVNRYESNMINTLDQAAAMIRAAGETSLFAHLDTFHMNIEEADIPAVIARNADLLGYVHLAESHRGLLGTGTFDIDGFLRALAANGYQGDITVESFSPERLSPELTGGVSLWRSGWSDAEYAARAAYQTLSAGVATAKEAISIWR